MVETLLCVEASRKACCTDKFCSSLGKLWCAGSGIDDLIGLRREAIVVVDHRWMRQGHDRELGPFPMTGDDKHCPWSFAYFRGHVCEGGF